MSLGMYKFTFESLLNKISCLKVRHDRTRGEKGLDMKTYKGKDHNYWDHTEVVID